METFAVEVQIVLLLSVEKRGFSATLFTLNVLVSTKPQGNVIVAVNRPPVNASGKKETVFPFEEIAVCVHPLGACQETVYWPTLYTLEQKLPEQVKLFKLKLTVLAVQPKLGNAVVGVIALSEKLSCLIFGVNDDEVNTCESVPSCFLYVTLQKTVVLSDLICQTNPLSLGSVVLIFTEIPLTNHSYFAIIRNPVGI
jgi:hypothetical protein